MKEEDLWRDNPDLKQGDKIAISAAIPDVWNVARVQVGTFLGVIHNQEWPVKLEWHLHPLAGRQELEMKHILKVKKVPPDSKVFLPRKMKAQEMRAVREEGSWKLTCSAHQEDRHTLIPFGRAQVRYVMQDHADKEHPGVPFRLSIDGVTTRYAGRLPR